MFLLYSLVVRLPCSLIFWQFWLFIVLKFVVALLLVVQGGQVCLLMPESWPEVLQIFTSYLFTFFTYPPTRFPSGDSQNILYVCVACP